jgi:hypothetical protein
MLIEVLSLEKKCQVLLNLDYVVEIAPLTDGTCELVLDDGSGGAGAKSKMRVKDSYDMFKQFAMHTVTMEDIDKKFPKATAPKKKEKDRHEFDLNDIPKL